MRLKQLSAPVATFKLAAALERYDMRLRALADRSLDLDLVRRVQQEFGELRLLCASLPKLSVSWTAVLLSRSRLLQALCQRTAPAASALLHEHLAAVEGLRRRCLRAMGAQGVGLT